MPFRRTSIDSDQRTGFYSPKRSRVVGSRRIFEFDADALTYINAVEAADGEALEFNVKTAYNAFVVGCKSDGIWSAIKASCIMAGARTLSGALVPLVGVAPSGFNLASGEYSRASGLEGDGVSMYLDTNRLRTAESQNSYHISVYASTLHTSGTVGFYAGNGLSDGGTTGFTLLGRLAPGNHYTRNTCTTFTDLGSSVVGFFGSSRASSSNYTARQAQSNTSITQTSETRPTTTAIVFAGRLIAGSPNAPTDARLGFYSIGESLDLALLDNRVTVLMSGIQNAIP